MLQHFLYSIRIWDEDVTINSTSMAVLVAVGAFSIFTYLRTSMGAKELSDETNTDKDDNPPSNNNGSSKANENANQGDTQKNDNNNDNNHDENDSPTSANAIRKAASGTVWSIVVKLLSFLCTQQAFRLLDDNIAALGRAAIQLELLLTTVLFVSREGFRLSLTRGDAASAKNWNVAWLSIPVAAVTSTIALVWHLYTSNSVGDTDYRWGGILYCLAAFIEVLAEPAALHALRQMEVATRVSAEGMASLCKTLATVMALKQWLPHWPIFSFGVAQLVYAMVYAIFLYTKTWSQLKPVNLKEGFDSGTCYMTLLFTVQGLFKHCLTEADRIVLSTLAGSYDQGVYAMASAYGGLAARFLLQPIEETARLLWSRVSGGSSHDDDNVLEQSYVVLVKAVLYVGLTFCCLATNYTSILLNILAGRKWGSNEEAVTVLSAFCVYTAFMAWNGMTEAFVFGVASSGGDVGRLGVMHSVVGVVFAVIAPLCVSKFGTVGVVAANCICMALRSLYSVLFAAKYFAEHRNKATANKNKSTTTTNNDNNHEDVSTRSMFFRLVGKMLPHPAVLICFVASAAATRRSLHLFQSQGAPPGSREWYLLALNHIILGGMFFVGTCVVAFPLETEFRRSIRQLLRPKQD